MNLTLVLNSTAGTLRGLDPLHVAEELADIFRGRGHSVRTEVHAGRAAVVAIARICRDGKCDAVVVGGGDGTISAAAAAAAQSGLTLGVLPLGTMNLFARSLKIPLTMREAAEALAIAGKARVDIGAVNGRYFIHHVTLGLHPRIIRIREQLSYSSRLGKIWAGILAWWMVVRQPPRLSVRIRADDLLIERRSTAILVSNNPWGEGHLPYPDDLQQGRLGLYLTTSRHWRRLVELAARMTFGEYSENPLLESWQAKNLEISPGRSLIGASVDGEIVVLQTPVRLRVVKHGLSVLRPASADAGRGGASGDADIISRLSTELPQSARVQATTRPDPHRHEEPMTEELSKTEARQGDRRRMNKTVVLIGTPLAFILLGVIFLIWA